MPGCGGRSGAGLGHLWGSELCPRWPLRGSAQATHGFSVRAQEPGTLLRTPAGPGAGSALGWHRQRLPGAGGGSAQPQHLPHGPACHTRTLPSAIGLGQLCPPEIITSFLLLLLLLLLQSPSPPPRPRGGPSRVSPLPPAQLCTLGALRLRLHSRSHRPRLQCLSCCYLSFPVDLGWLGVVGGEVRWGPQTPGLAPGAAGRSSFARSHHLTSI